MGIGRLSRFAPVLAVALSALGLSLSASADIGDSERIGKQPDGSVITSTNQRLTPAGQQVEFVGRPTAVAVSPDGGSAAFLNGTGLAGPEVVTVDLASGASHLLDSGRDAGSYDGIVYSKDGSTIYASDAGGTVHVVSPLPGNAAGQSTSITMPGSNPDPGGLALSGDGSKLYVALSRNNSVAVVDVSSKSVTKEIPVGNAPHSVLTLGNYAYVTNEGGRLPQPGDFTNLSSGTKIVADRYRGDAATGTVSVIDLGSNTVVKSIDVGLHPTAIYFAFGSIFVANTNSDTVSVIDPGAKQVAGTFSVAPYPGAPYGAFPTGITSLDSNQLVVSLGRENALGIYHFEGPTNPVRMLGLIPTGWYPSSVATDKTRRHIVVANDKGVGSLAVSEVDPLGVLPKMVQEYVASASLIPYPSAADLAKGTAQVIHNNGWDKAQIGCPVAGAAPVAIPQNIGEPSLIKHVFFVVKENRTYDQIMGDDMRGNGSLVGTTYGQAITPNQHAIALRWPLFDNFYDSGSLSADGHQWVVQGMAPDYLEKAFGSFPRSYPAMGYDALTYLPSGFLWEDALQHGKTVTNYAEYGFEENAAQVASGQKPETSDIPSNDQNMVRDYPGFDLSFPDQHRADIFLKHFADNVKAGQLANLTFIRLPDDHTGGTNPDFPSPLSEVADNDQALGRILDAVSHSQFWNDTAFFVEEDDSQDGPDHVDGHRSTLFVMSPYGQKGIVDHTYYTQVNVVRTIEQILGLPPMNQLDMAATPMRDAFMNTPDAAPYTAIMNPLIALGSLNPPVAALSGLQKEWAMWASQQDFQHTDAPNAAALNRDLWYAAKGFDVPYPGDSRVLHPSEVEASPAGSTDVAESAPVPGGPPAPSAPDEHHQVGMKLSCGAGVTAAGTQGATLAAGSGGNLPNTGGKGAATAALVLILLGLAIVIARKRLAQQA